MSTYPEAPNKASSQPISTDWIEYSNFYCHSLPSADIFLISQQKQNVVVSTEALLIIY